MVVRNIPFKQCTAEQLRTSFTKFGAVADVNIPLNERGLPRGFAFIEFEKLPGASAAVTAGTMKLAQREVTVDWAVAKDKYEQLTGAMAQLGLAREFLGQSHRFGACCANVWRWHGWCTQTVAVESR